MTKWSFLTFLVEKVTKVPLCSLLSLLAILTESKAIKVVFRARFLPEGQEYSVIPSLSAQNPERISRESDKSDKSAVLRDSARFWTKVTKVPFCAKVKKVPSLAWARAVLYATFRPEEAQNRLLRRLPSRKSDKQGKSATRYSITLTFLARMARARLPA